jgi:hypothetical protein
MECWSALKGGRERLRPNRVHKLAKACCEISPRHGVIRAPDHTVPTGRFFRGTLSQALRARLRSGCPSGTRCQQHLVRAPNDEELKVSTKLIPNSATPELLPITLVAHNNSYTFSRFRMGTGRCDPLSGLLCARLV